MQLGQSNLVGRIGGVFSRVGSGLFSNRARVNTPRFRVGSVGPIIARPGAGVGTPVALGSTQTRLSTGQVLTKLANGSSFTGGPVTTPHTVFGRL